VEVFDLSVGLWVYVVGGCVDYEELVDLLWECHVFEYLGGVVGSWGMCD